MPISTVTNLELERYAGLWHEVASFPTAFQAGCKDTTATYEVMGPGTISILNACVREGEVTRIIGTGRVTGPGRLNVDLSGVPFDADYWVLWIDEGYRTAVVGTPSGNGGWILNRTPHIPGDRLAAAREVLRFNGYDLKRLKMTERGGP